MKMTSRRYANDVLASIKNANKIIISKREKNIEFMKRYALLQEDVEYYIKNLKDNTFVERKENKDKSIDADYMYIFYPNFCLEDEYGESMESVYIKVCELKNREKTIFVVSFHDKYNF